MERKDICVVGLGYIGLPTAVLLAKLGHRVNGVEINTKVIKVINEGRSHIIEPGLQEIVQKTVKSGFLQTSITPIISDIYIICVPTPIYFKEGKPIPDITEVIRAIDNIKPFIKSGDMVILESTCPVGTIEKLKNILNDSNIPINDVHFAYCPERVLPGNVLVELVENDRIIGGINKKSTNIVAQFYRTFVKGKVFETSAKTAELCKLAENSFRDVNIAFANELSLICDKEKINVWELIDLANRHPRVQILQPGPGVGGHCIAVDPWFIVSQDTLNTRIIRTAREINNYKTEWVIEKIKANVADIIMNSNPKPLIVCLGLAFKPNIDDLRESPAIHIATSLVKSGYNVVSVEPNIESHNVLNLLDLENAVNDADLIVILVKHKQFLHKDIQNRLKNKKILDFCGAFV